MNHIVGPVCSVPNQPCSCTGAADCSSLTGTRCNTNTGVCECPSGWLVLNNICTNPSCKYNAHGTFMAYLRFEAATEMYTYRFIGIGMPT